MKQIGIIYGGKTGTTKKAALELAARLENAQVFSVDDRFELDKFDLIVLGTPIRMGKFDRRIIKLITDHEAVLKIKQVGIFICHCSPDYQKTVANLIPTWLQGKAFAITSFGGELNPDKEKCLARFLIKIIQKTVKDHLKSLNYQAIDDFAKLINE